MNPALPVPGSDLAAVEGAPPRPTMRARLDEVMGRVHKKLDKINGDTGKIALRLSPKVTRMAQQAFTEEDLPLEEEDDDDATD